LTLYNHFPSCFPGLECLQRPEAWPIPPFKCSICSCWHCWSHWKFIIVETHLCPYRTTTIHYFQNSSVILCWLQRKAGSVSIVEQ